MSLAATAVVVFLCGALYEAGCIGFIHFSERGRPLATALCSMLTCGAEISGILGSVHDWRTAPFYVLGYGTGAYCAVRYKSRRA